MKKKNKIDLLNGKNVKLTYSVSDRVVEKITHHSIRQLKGILVKSGNENALVYIIEDEENQVVSGVLISQIVSIEEIE